MPLVSFEYIGKCELGCLAKHNYLYRSLGFKNPLGACSRSGELHAGSSAAKAAAPLRNDRVCRGLARFEQTNQPTVQTRGLHGVDAPHMRAGDCSDWRQILRGSAQGGPGWYARGGALVWLYATLASLRQASFKNYIDTLN